MNKGFGNIAIISGVCKIKGHFGHTLVFQVLNFGTIGNTDMNDTSSFAACRGKVFYCLSKQSDFFVCGLDRQ